MLVRNYNPGSGVDPALTHHPEPSLTGWSAASWNACSKGNFAFGLYGLAAFTAERRTREIGIRKVLGARNRDIVRLLVWQFSRPVLIANLIAWPVAWWLMRDWLDGFARRIDLGPQWFVLAGLLAAAIAAATIIGHALRVASRSPALALRYE